MQTTVLALALGSAAAFVGPAAQAPATAVNAGQGDLVALAEANGDQLGRNLGFWDPLGASSLDFFGLEQSGRLPSGATVGYLRHAEIKHGRVAMAAFVGYCIQANGVRFPWTPYPGFQDGLTPPEQWANVPAAGKWQFFVFIGILEALGECFPSGEHYMAGGRPGVYPSLTEPNDQMRACGLYPPHGFNVDLLPFRASLAKQDEAKRARGRQVEINNGRLAMLGIFSLLSESAAPGAVPPLTLVNYIVDASGLTELNFPSIDLPVIGTVGGWAFLNSFPQYTPPADLSIVTAVSQFSTPGNALLGAVGN